MVGKTYSRVIVRVTDVANTTPAVFVVQLLDQTSAHVGGRGAERLAISCAGIALGAIVNVLAASSRNRAYRLGEFVDHFVDGLHPVSVETGELGVVRYLDFLVGDTIDDTESVHVELGPIHLTAFDHLVMLV